MQVRVIDVIKRSSDVKSIRVEKNENLNFIPGQFFKFTIKNQSRYLSASSSPLRNFIEFTKRLTSSEFSKNFDVLEKNDSVILEGPYGKFSLQHDDKKILFIAGGIGITPVFSILEHSFITKDTRNMILLYGNKTGNIPFKKELIEFEKGINLKILFFTEEFEPECYHGCIDVNSIRNLVPDFNERTTFISGPPAMVENIKNQIQDAKLDVKIRTEKLIGY
ncbi:MAG: FAD-dependent oxidoreductase [Candidatus Omnitrophica bacterium]|nr:FAD-dependent oxidoreductase [Candidatus Omnitrophota bacterium]